MNWPYADAEMTLRMPQDLIQHTNKAIKLCSMQKEPPVSEVGGIGGGISCTFPGRVVQDRLHIQWLCWRYSYWRWWIIRPALSKHTLGCIFVIEQCGQVASSRSKAPSDDFY